MYTEPGKQSDQMSTEPGPRVHFPAVEEESLSTRLYSRFPMPVSTLWVESYTEKAATSHGCLVVRMRVMLSTSWISIRVV
jgi:hypothetical protein